MTIDDAILESTRRDAADEHFMAQQNITDEEEIPETHPSSY